MKKLTRIIALLLMALSLSIGIMSDANAKRFGGGGSFGGVPLTARLINAQRSLQAVRLLNNKQLPRIKRQDRVWQIVAV